jgi:AAA domain
MSEIFSEILQWSEEQPGWQRDALRRLFTSGPLSTADIGELVEICKAAHGLSAIPRTPDPLRKEYLATKTRQTAPVSIVSVTHHHGVNALAAEQTVAFGQNLTIVYGQNAAGKSGYTRILKRACRSRGIENILGNVLSGETPLKPQATIGFLEGLTEVSFEWGSDVGVPDALGAVSVFDAHCVPVYLRDKTDVAFRPFGLDVFDKLSTACGEVRARLEAEQEILGKIDPKLPSVPEGTSVKATLDSLTALTKVDTIREMATLSADEEDRLKELRNQQRDLQSSDPKRLARDLNLKAERMKALIKHLEELQTVLSDSAMLQLRSAAEKVQVAQQVLALTRKAAFTREMLPGTGEDAWKSMWEAAGEFSAVAYPGAAFPVITKDARCPLCQQALEPGAANRLKHFAEYITSEAQKQRRDAETEYQEVFSKVDVIVVDRTDIKMALSELADDDAGSAERVKELLEVADRRQKAIRNAAGKTSSLPAHGITGIPFAKLTEAVKALQERASLLQGQKSTLDPKVAAELSSLEARTTLKSHLQSVLDEIERKKRLAAYRQCFDDTATQSVTRKSTELTKKLVTDHLRKTFQDELSRIEFKHLAVEVQSAGGTKGALFHRLIFTNAPGIPVTDVLSEGESRALSLAAFLTELSTASTGSAIIFDDPVSSLDHIWRERIARRLVAEAKGRQVIVFTHDLLFLRFLLDECSRQNVRCQNQYVRRDGAAGLCSPELPWIAMNVRDRIGRLRSLWQGADKLKRTSSPEAYEAEARNIYGLLREAWEQAVGEVLLYDVIERYRHSIETQKMRYLHDITKADCDAVEDGMTECSRWMRGHDHPPADGTPFPIPAELQKRINDLDDWVKAIRKRR